VTPPIFEELGMRDRTEITGYAIRVGLLLPEPDPTSTDERSREGRDLPILISRAKPHPWWPR
jgi:hypothetical protein